MSQKKHRLSLTIVFFVILIDLMGFGMIIPLIPFLGRHLGADTFQVSFLLTCFSGMQFLCAPIWGKMSDCLGRKTVLLIGLTGTMLSYLLFAFSLNFYVLLLSRFLSGIFSATVSVTTALIGDITKKKDRSQSMGIIGAAFGLGFILGPVLGGLLLEVGNRVGSHPPWGQNFVALAAALIAFFNWLFTFFFLREGVSSSLRKEMLEKKKKERQDHFIQQDKTKRTNLFSKFFRKTFYSMSPTIFLFMVVFFLFSLSMSHLETCLFFFVQDKLNWTLREASFSFAYVGVIMVLTQGVFLRKLMFLGEKKLLWSGLFLGTLGFFLTGLSDGVLDLVISITFVGVGSALVQSTLRGIISLLTEKGKQGENMGWLHSLSALGRTLGPLLGGFVYRDFGSSFPFYLAGFFTFIALCVSLVLNHKTPIGSQMESQ